MLYECFTVLLVSRQFCFECWMIDMWREALASVTNIPGGGGGRGPSSPCPKIQVSSSAGTPTYSLLGQAQFLCLGNRAYKSWLYGFRGLLLTSLSRQDSKMCSEGTYQMLYYKCRIQTWTEVRSGMAPWCCQRRWPTELYRPDFGYHSSESHIPRQFFAVMSKCVKEIPPYSPLANLGSSMVRKAIHSGQHSVGKQNDTREGDHITN
jgi:hypothetical protein